MRVRTERRISTRGNFQFAVTIGVGGRRRIHRSIDLSATGLMVERAPGSDALEGVTIIELALPDREQPVRLLARAVWNTPDRTGLHFVGLPTHVCRELSNFVARQPSGSAALD